MKMLLPIPLVVLCFFTTTTLSQDFIGSATYKTATKMQIQLDSASFSAEQQRAMQARLQKAMQKEFELTFNATESNWKEVLELDKETGTQGMRVVTIGTGGGADGLLYKNTKAKTFKETTDAFGKLFLVSGSLELYEWQVTSETKQIGKYTCYKAVMEREQTRTIISEINGEAKEKEETVSQTLTAWYTPDIPVNHGPDAFWGLPGLILEATDGNRTMICTQVILNPRKEVTIVEPTKGTKVTEEEFEGVMREQTKKMNKMYEGGRKKGQNGSSVRIRVNG